MKHWTETDFQHWLYGLKDDDAHLTECSECRAQSERLKQEQQRVSAEAEVSHEFLTAQRRRIYQRLEHPGRNRIALRWVLSFAMLLVMVAGVTVERLYQIQNPPAISDEQLFRDLSSIEQSAEPRAIQPIHNLFEE